MNLILIDLGDTSSKLNDKIFFDTINNFTFNNVRCNECKERK